MKTWAPGEFEAKTAELIRREIEAGVAGWWYLSFVGDDGAWKGGCIVQAFGMVDAVQQSHMRGINPGGHVSGMPTPSDAVIPDGARNRLLTRDELTMYFGETESVRELRRG